MLVEETVDVTLPTGRRPRGSRHPLTLMSDYIADLFVAMGWEVAEGPVLEAEWLNFDALNLGPDHPARTMQDTFWTEPAEDHLVLRTHTSPVQARTMLERTPPIYVICPGRVFRTDPFDATHSPMFHQVEGLVVDEGITMANLKGTLDHFAQQLFGEGVVDPVPSVLLPVHRAVRRGRFAVLRLPWRGRPSTSCRTCRGEGWIEWGGCGVVNPRVLDRLWHRLGALPRLRLRHGDRPVVHVPQRRGGPASRCSRATCDSRRRSAPTGDRAPSLRTADPHPTARITLMRAPVSWIREYADLPPDLSAEELARKLTSLGLKLEALERPGAQVSGPLVVGRVLTLEAEPQKNGKTINWCTVDVADANGTGDPQGIVCGAHNFAVGDLVVVVLPGGVLPGNFEISARQTYGHVSAGMICSARELGIGDDHDGIIVLAPDTGEPGDDARPLLGLDEEVIEFEINPDRAYALSLRGVAREAAMGFGTAYTDPCLRDAPVPNADGYPVRVEDAAGCPVFVARTVTGFDPTAESPAWLRNRVRLAGMRPISLAVDVTNYVMLETGRPIHGYDGDRLQGPIVVRRATLGERLTTLDGVTRELSTEDLVVCDDSGAIGLGGVMGGATTEMSDATTTVVIEAAHWDPVSMFRTGQAAPAHLRGRQAERARRRPDDL